MVNTIAAPPRVPHPVVTPGPLVPAQPGPNRGGTLDWDDYLKYLARNSPTPRSVNQAAGPQTNAIDAKPYLPDVYGLNLIRGQQFWASTGDVQYAYYWLALSRGEIDDILMVDGNYQMSVNGINPFLYGLPFAITIYKGSQTQAEDPVLATALGWSPGGLPGLAYVRVGIGRKPDKPSWVYSVPGFTGTESAPSPPDITFNFHMRGKKTYDPRAGMTVWSQNPALHWRDLRVSSGVDPSVINDISFGTAADNCDARTWLDHVDDGSKRFISNLVVSSQANLQSYLDQLAIACNGHESWADGKMCLTVETENENPAVLTLDSTKNFSSINYTWLGQKERPTQVRIDFRNKNAQPPYKEDFVLVPENLAAGVEPVLASYTSSVITDRIHAARAAAYIYNVANGTPFHAEGECTYEGINALQRSTKILLTTSEGVAVQEMLVDVGRETPSGWHMTLRQYDRDVYRDIAVTETQPISYIPGYDQGVIGPPAEATCPVLQATGILTWRASRLYEAGSAPTLSEVYTWTLDLGAGNAKAMGRLKMDCSTNGGPGSINAVQYSDDNSSWTSVDHSQFFYGRGYAQTFFSHTGTQWWYVDWDTPAAPHRYWKAVFGSSPSVDGSLFLPVLSEVDPTITGYEIHNSNAPFIGSGTPSNADPIFLAGNEALNSADLTAMVTFSGYPYCVPTLVAVRRFGTRSAGVTCSASDVTGAPYVAIQAGTLIQQPGGSYVSGSQRASASLIADTSLGVGNPTPGSGYTTSGYGKIVELKDTAATPGHILTGSQTSDAILADLAFGNAAIGGTDNRVAVLRALRSAANDSGKVQLFTRDAGNYVTAISIEPNGVVTLVISAKTPVLGLTAAAPGCSGGSWALYGTLTMGATVKTTIGANGAASAPTANPVGYIGFDLNGTTYQIPFYNS